MKCWTVRVLTLFPELFPGPLGVSVTGRGLKNNLWNLLATSIRDFSDRVDDTPYGGGSGMVMRPDVLAKAIRAKFDFSQPIIYLSPRGKLFNQDKARELIKNYQGINIICGRFEGIDERIIEKFSVTEISIGDYVLSSGDLAAYVLIDSCVRNIPGVLSDENALQGESFGDSDEYRNLLEYPHYTKPPVFEGLPVPDALLSGNHAEIKKWRLEAAQVKTKKVRD